MLEKAKQLMKIGTVLFVALVITMVILLSSASKTNVNSNMNRRAFNELSSTVADQVEFINYGIAQQYLPINSIATYISVKDEDYIFSDSKDYFNAVVLSNELCTLGYADLSGNAISHEGEDLGNVSERDYFKNAIEWKGYNAIEYLPVTSRVNEPRILFSVPVRRNNELRGVVFAAKKIGCLNELLVSNSFDGEDITFIMDSTGNIIASNRTVEGHLQGENIFETHDFASSEDEIRNNLLMRKGGELIFEHHGEEEYMVYQSLGISDWTLCTLVGSDAITAKYKGNSEVFVSTIHTLEIAFVAAVVLLCLVFLLWIYQINQQKGKLDYYYVLLQDILDKMHAAAIEYNVDSQKIVSYGYLQMLPGVEGNQELNSLGEWIEEFPHVDFTPIISARDQLLQNKSSVRTSFFIPDDSGGSWMELAMTPVLDANRRVKSVFGLITDVTELYSEHQIVTDTNFELLSNMVGEGCVFRVDLLTGKVIFHYCKGVRYEGISFNYVSELTAYLKNIVVPEYQHILDMMNPEQWVERYQEFDSQRGIEFCINARGDIRWMNGQVLVSWDSTSERYYATLIFRDIHEQKQLELRSFEVESNVVEGSKGDSDEIVKAGETEEVPKVFIRTFGYFDVFVNGEPVCFTNSKEKELLAILIDRNGGTLSAEEAISILWENEPCGDKQLGRYRKLAMKLKNTLRDLGIENILIVNRGIRSINKKLVICDYYKFLDGEQEYIKMFADCYMFNYSWAENTTALLMDMRDSFGL